MTWTHNQWKKGLSPYIVLVSTTVFYYTLHLSPQEEHVLTNSSESLELYGTTDKGLLNTHFLNIFSLTEHHVIHITTY